MRKNKFIAEMLKASFLLMILLGTLALVVGLVLCFYPDVLIKLIQWGGIGLLVIGGSTLIVISVYGYLTARKSAS